MRLPFTKMHGLGNDFVMLDATSRPIELSSRQACHIADRHFGIGCDQILVAEPPRSAAAQFTYRIYNADGSESGQCGNGARCFARFVRDRGLTDADSIVVDVGGGQMSVQVLPDHRYRVALGVPVFEPAAIPLAGFARDVFYNITDVAACGLRCQALALGNPHVIVRTQDIVQAPIQTVGRALQTHAALPERANVGFMQIVSRRHILLRVYERGVGETLACGSGTAAAVVAGISSGDLDAQVRVDLPGGQAQVAWAGQGLLHFRTAAALLPKISSDKARGAGRSIPPAKPRNAGWRNFGRNPSGRGHFSTILRCSSLR